jgi:hypothetical protein
MRAAFGWLGADLLLVDDCLSSEQAEDLLERWFRRISSATLELVELPNKQGFDPLFELGSQSFPGRSN